MEKVTDKYKFIKTQDRHTRQTLLSLGFMMIADDGKTATFVNDSKLNFGDADLKKAAFTNKLNF